MAEAGAGLAEEHGADGEAHDEEAAEAEHELALAAELVAVAIEHGYGERSADAVEDVEARGFDVEVGEHGDAESDLREHRAVRNPDADPKRSVVGCGSSDGEQAPQPDGAVRQHDDPRQHDMDEFEGVHGRRRGERRRDEAARAAGT